MYVVAGVTGNTGKIVAESLLAQGKPVRVVARDAKKGEAWRARGAEVARIELDDVEGLTKALRGATGAYLLLPPNMASTALRADNARQSAGYAKAVEASGVPHVVFLSSIGSELAEGTGPIVTTHDAELALRKTRAALTFVHAGYFMENWASSLYALDRGALPTFLTGDKTVPMVATKDIGATAARALVEGGKGETTIELSGPRDYTPRDVAAALSRVVGKPIALEVGPEDAMIGALTAAGLNAQWAELFREMTHALNAGQIKWQGGVARAVRGPTTIDEVLASLVKR